MLNRAVRFIFRPGRTEHITPYLKKLHFLPISFRIKFKICLVSFKVYNNMAPNYLKKDFKLFRPQTNISLRPGAGRDECMFNVTVLPHRKDTILQIFKEEWNRLPLELRQLNSLQIFKRRLKHHFFRKAFPDDT